MTTPDSTSPWHARAASLVTDGRLFINGERVPAKDGQTFEKHSPLNGLGLGTVARGQKADIDAAVAAARAAFADRRWAGQSPKARKKVLQRWSELVLAARDELALLETLDMGKPISHSLAVDVPATANCIAWYGEAVDKLYDEIAPTADTALALITREAMGVIGAIVPWNYPLIWPPGKGPLLWPGETGVF
jgi:acyl-CoA reductase-like NAD-dependent aldehyde dehydrogenase